jgi:hyperosmotically inducible protein
MTTMRLATRATVLLVLLALVTVGCAQLTGKTAGETVDDATITAAVKSKLAAEKASTLTKVDVDTVKGTVYLRGSVDKAEVRDRATQLARDVKGVREVVNNLTVASTPATSTPSSTR